MSEQSSMHPFVNWTKQRLDEMDAALASLQANASKLQAEAKARAEQVVADLKKHREEFQTKAKAQAQASETTLQATKAQLEDRWYSFERQLKTYFETVGKQVEQHQSAFRDIAAAQIKAWREAADKLHDAASKMAADKRASIDAAVKQMKADATEAEARLQKLKQAGRESWAALSAALAESRKAFDRANQKVGDELKRATASKA